jgi:hypothetical protein
MKDQKICSSMDRFHTLVNSIGTITEILCTPTQGNDAMLESSLEQRVARMETSFQERVGGLEIIIHGIEDTFCTIMELLNQHIKKRH